MTPKIEAGARKEQNMTQDTAGVAIAAPHAAGQATERLQVLEAWAAAEKAWGCRARNRGGEASMKRRELAETLNAARFAALGEYGKGCNDDD
jgi:hypothetical protein